MVPAIPSRVRRVMLAALGGAAALAAAAAAWAGDVQTFQVAAAGQPATAGFAPDVAAA